MTLYVTDLDGTLLKNDKTLSKRSVKTLNRLIKSGAAVTYATARSFTSASPLINSIDFNFPAVTFNGVFIVDPKSGEHIIENIFSKQALRAAEKFIEENALAPLVYSYIDEKERVSYLENRLRDVFNYVNSRRGDKRLRAVSDYKELFFGNVFYITLFNVTDAEKCDAFFCEENGFSHNVQADNYDDMIWYEIYGKNAGKEKAVLQLKKLLNANELICFGDSFNDMKMLKLADVGVAVENGCEELKKAADVVIEKNEDDAVIRFIEQRESKLLDRNERFDKAVKAAFDRIKGAHGSVGTQNEKLIHAALKNYYAPFFDEQEIKIANYFADAVSEDGIFEIQSRQFYRLCEKLKAFLPAARVNVVYPLVCETKTVYINTESGETKETPKRKNNSLLKAFEEIYSIRRFLRDENLTVIIARIAAEKRIYYNGEHIPDIRKKSEKKKCIIENVPVRLVEEIVFKGRSGYKKLLPENLPEEYTKKEFLKTAGDAKSSLKLEILREAGIIKRIGKRGKEYLYKTEDV